MFLTLCRVVYVRENRVTGVVVHILIGVSLLMLPYPLAYIPPAVLDGLFLYLAVTALNNNQLFERLTLLFTEQVSLCLLVSSTTHHVCNIFCKIFVLRPCNKPSTYKFERQNFRTGRRIAPKFDTHVPIDTLTLVG